MKDLIKELTILQSKTIGLFKNKHTRRFELVIEYINDQEFTTVTVGDLGGLSTSYTHTGQGEVKLFPNKSLLSMMDDILELHKFCKSFN